MDKHTTKAKEKKQSNLYPNQNHYLFLKKFQIFLKETEKFVFHNLFETRKHACQNSEAYNSY